MTLRKVRLHLQRLAFPMLQWLPRSRTYRNRPRQHAWSESVRRDARFAPFRIAVGCREACAALVVISTGSRLSRCAASSSSFSWAPLPGRREQGYRGRDLNDSRSAIVDHSQQELPNAWRVWVADSDFLGQVSRVNRQEPEDVAVSTSPLKAREIEALTFISTASEPVTLAVRNRWSDFFNWAWVKLRKRIRGPPPAVR